MLSTNETNKKYGTKKILVVDDDTNITDLTQLILESAGYECKATNSGRDCLRLLDKTNVQHDDSSNKFDLVLLDVAMPGFSGIDVVNKLREQKLFPLNHVVFFTASSSSALDESELRRLGVLDCFKKPFSKPDLLKSVQRYVSDLT